MKKSVIKALLEEYKDNLKSSELMSKEYKENMKTACGIYDELQEKLSPELFELYERYTDASDDSWMDEIDFFFVEGFKLGLRVGIECIDD